MSDVAVDTNTNTNTNTNTIYAGIRYYQGGREGIFIIPDANQNDSKLSGAYDVNSRNNLSNPIKFIPLGSTGPEQILVNDQMKTIYALLEYDDFIATLDGSTNEIKEKIILQNPRAMSTNPSIELLYVASGDSFWFNVIDMNVASMLHQIYRSLIQRQIPQLPALGFRHQILRMVEEWHQMERISGIQLLRI